MRAIEENAASARWWHAYPRQATHDIERNAALLIVDEVTATAEKRIVELREQRLKLDVEMEFYKRTPTRRPCPCVADR